MARTYEDEPTRGLTDAERGVIEFLLSVPFSGRDQLRAQLESAKAVVDPSMAPPDYVRISVERDPTTRARVNYRTPVKAYGRDVDGRPSGTMLHVVNGWMDKLETWREGPGYLSTLPNPQELVIVAIDGKLLAE